MIKVIISLTYYLISIGDFKRLTESNNKKRSYFPPFCWLIHKHAALKFSNKYSSSIYSPIITIAFIKDFGCSCTPTSNTFALTFQIDNYILQCIARKLSNRSIIVKSRFGMPHIKLYDMNLVAKNREILQKPLSCCSER